jgi:glycosyltransferase involved in cell wall biosynthesis
MPFLSTLIATYNDGDVVTKAIDSVLGQTIADVEVVVVDDGSVDGTYERLTREYGNEVQVLRQSNQGPGAARNLAFAEARGDYVSFLDADDIYLPWTVETIADAAHAASDPPFVELATFVSDDPTAFSRIQRKPPRVEHFRDHLSYPGISLHTTLPSNAVVRRDVFTRAGGFWSHRMGEDTDLWLRLGVEPGFLRILSPFCVGRMYSPRSYGERSENRVLCARLLVEAEQSGRYPGGAARAPQRHQYIGTIVRSACRRAIREGDLTEAWDLYRATAAWHVPMRHYKYLVGFPLVAAAEGARRAVRKPWARFSRTSRQRASGERR